jgi:hypothetical protein
VNAAAATVVTGEPGSLGPGGRAGELRLGWREVRIDTWLAGKGARRGCSVGAGGGSVRRGGGRSPQPGEVASF